VIERPIAVLGAPSAIGIRPYDDGTIRRLDLAPNALREQGLITRLAADDLGDVRPPSRYADVERPVGRPRNEDDVIAYSQALAARVEEAGDRFLLLLGGDCSILLGTLLGLRRARGAPVGLVYVDAHADYATLEGSPSGSPCSMNLSLATARVDTALARLDGSAPLVRSEDVVHIGARELEPRYGRAALAESEILAFSQDQLRTLGPANTARAALARASQSAGGFLVHVDVDVLDPEIMPAVDTPEPDGLGLPELAGVLAPLVASPNALGLQLTIYDPTLDPDRSCAARLATLLTDVLS
jgi:arginase